MARKSRKQCEAVHTVNRERTYRTAIYVRLSYEDERKIEQETLRIRLRS